MHAADAKTCDACVKAATAKAQAVRQFNCGFDLSDPRWGSGRSGHASWCKAASKDAVVAETAQRRGQFKVCQLCRTYTDLATAAAADNANASCGFSGARWSAKAEDHFGWCMTRRNSDDATKAMATGSYTALTAVIEQLLGRETGERTLGMRAANCDSPLLRAAGREADRADDRIETEAPPLAFGRDHRCLIDRDRFHVSTEAPVTRGCGPKMRVEMRSKKSELMRKISNGAVVAAGALVLFAVPAHAQFGGGGLLPELPDPGNSPPSELIARSMPPKPFRLPSKPATSSAASTPTRRNGRPMRLARRPFAARSR